MPGTAELLLSKGKALGTSGTLLFLSIYTRALTQAILVDSLQKLIPKSGSSDEYSLREQLEALFREDRAQYATLTLVCRLSFLLTAMLRQVHGKGTRAFGNVCNY